MKNEKLACGLETKNQKVSITRAMITDDNGRPDRWKIGQLLKKGFKLEEMPFNTVIYSSYLNGFNVVEVEDMNNYCKKYIEKTKWTLINVYKDCYTSNMLGNMGEALKEVLADADRGCIDLIVTPEIKCISEDVEFIFNTMRCVDKQGIGFMFMTENICTFEANTEFKLSIYKAMVQYEQYLNGRRQELYMD